MSGTKRTFMGLQELLACYHKETVRSDGAVFHFTRGCPPKAKGTRPSRVVVVVVVLAVILVVK